MKKILFILFATMMLQSCSKLYYQVYKVEAENMQSDRNKIVYDDENCSIIYNLWDKQGNLSFVFANKTDKDICIDLTQSFYIRNGIAFDYFEDKSYTYGNSTEYTSTASVMKSYSAHISKSIAKAGYTHTPYLWTPTAISLTGGIGVNKGLTFTEGEKQSFSSSVTINPVKQIYVPANSSKAIRGFRVSNYVYKDSINKKFNLPKKESEEIKYTEKTSPLQFRNRITYIIDKEEHHIDNAFWVKSVKNYNKKVFFSKTIHIGRSEYYFNFEGADMFYNVYDNKPK